MATGCEEIRELLSALVDGELDETCRKIISAHVLTCPECRRLAGGLVAAKGLTHRSAPGVDVPVGFHARLRARLDRVDGVRSRVAASRPARRLVAIAAVGAIAASIAVIFSTVYLINADRALALAHLHQQLAGTPTAPAGVGGLSPVSRNPATESWVETRRAMVRIDGTVVGYTLYEVGACPVSVFEGPAEWNPYRTGWLVSERVGDLDVRQVGHERMTSWRQAGSRYVLVAEATPEQLAAFAYARMALSRRSPGL